MTAGQPQSINDYLIARLHAYGVRHMFGIPGDYVISLYNAMQESGLILPINTVDEQGAGFAADMYARIRGLGVCVHTFGVGGLKAIHTTAEAYAERSPVVVVSGAPGLKERTRGALLHHQVKGLDGQLKAFEQVTVATAFLDNPMTAFAEIDRVLSAALQHKRPVYLEIPRDLFLASGDPDHQPSEYRRPGSNRQALAAALAEAVLRINQARQPVFWAGAELQRFGLKDTFRQLLEITNIPFASTVLGKGVISETHPSFLGVYQGALGGEAVQKYLETSDCLVMLGVLWTDINLGLFTAKIEQDQSIFVSADQVTIFRRPYEQVQLVDFVEGLIEGGIAKRSRVEVASETQSSLAQPGPALADLYLEGQDGSRLAIPPGESVAGRQSDCRIVLSDPSVSRQHATLLREGNRVWIWDLTSHNGTFVNDILLKGNARQPLQEGDEISFGRKAVYTVRGLLDVALDVTATITSMPTVIVNLAAAPTVLGQPTPTQSTLPTFAAVAGQPVKTRRLFEALNAFIDEKTVVCVDNGETLIAGADLLIRRDQGFYGPGYYTSVGFSTPAAMGVQFADPDCRPLVLTGDAAFQMTGVELSTLARWGLNPIVVVLNNGGYGSERPIHDGPFVDVLMWNYANFTQVVGVGKSFLVKTEDELEQALRAAREHTREFILLDVHLEKFDYSPAFERFLALFAKGGK